MTRRDLLIALCMLPVLGLAGRAHAARTRKTVVVGYSGCATDEAFLRRVRQRHGDLGAIEHYDMTRYPEKGDVIDALEQGLKPDLVIALNLYGVSSGQIVPEPGWLYNKRNHELRSVCAARGIAVAVWEPDA